MEECLGFSALLSSLAVGHQTIGFEGGCEGKEFKTCFFSWWSQLLCSGWCGIVSSLSKRKVQAAIATQVIVPVTPHVTSRGLQLSSPKHIAPHIA